jgi:DNA-binding MarR family transcriptional regulator
MPKPSQLNLARYVPGLLTFLANKLATGASQCYRKHFGIGVVEWRMLSMLAVENDITANRICQVIGLDKSAVSRSLQTLEAAGHVTSKADSRDGRRNTVSLTPSGQALHDRVLKVALERERRLLSGLTPAEVDTLVDLLGRMHAQIAHVNEYDPGNVTQDE